VGTLANGATAQLQITADVTDVAPITNRADAIAATRDPDTANNDATATVNVPDADLRLQKLVSNATPLAGDTVTYTLRLTNNGPDTATGVVVTDALPAGVTVVGSSAPAPTTYAAGVWTVPSIPSGQTRVLTIDVRVDVEGLITNTAEVTASDLPDPTSAPGDGAGDDFATVDLSSGPASADLSLTKVVSNPAPQVGSTVTYLLTLRNDGPSATTGVVVTDALPAGLTFVSATASRGSFDPTGGAWTVGTLASGSSATLRVVVRIDAAGPITNSAEVTASSAADPDSTPGNASTTEDDDAGATLTATATPTTADLRIVKSASRQSVRRGDTVTYAIVVSNQGPAAATNVGVTERFPAGLQFVSASASAGAYDAAEQVWTIPSIPSGGAATLTVVTRAVSLGQITNVAEITASDQTDPTPADEASATISVIAPPPPPTKLRITKTTPTKVVKAGGNVTFTITVKNTGTVPAINVALRDCVPSGLSLVRRPGNRGTLRNGALSWPLGTIPPGATRTVKITFKVDRNTRGFRGCTASAAGTNATRVAAGAQVRVVAGTASAPRTPVTG
jgi:uncharacterized repeat protein (TIGR01451 family)